MKIIELDTPTDYQGLQCQIFSDYVVNTNNDVYLSRGAPSIFKIKKDIKYGKLAECSIFNYYLQKENSSITPIDFTIYPARCKSFESDLQAFGFDVHVKSCLDESSFPNSWLFQRNDPLVQSPKQTDILALVVIKKGGSYAYICSPYEIEYEKPKLESMKATKVAIYEKDLI